MLENFHSQRTACFLKIYIYIAYALVNWFPGSSEVVNKRSECRQQLKYRLNWTIKRTRERKIQYGKGITGEMATLAVTSLSFCFLSAMRISFPLSLPHQMQSKTAIAKRCFRVALHRSMANNRRIMEEDIGNETTVKQLKRE